MLINLEPQTATLVLNEGDVVQYKHCDNIYNILILRVHETLSTSHYRLVDLTSSTLWTKEFNTTADLNKYFRENGREVIQVFKKNDLVLTTKGN